MLKSLSLSMSLALALGFTGVVKAGGFMGMGHGGSTAGCTTCGLASPQGTTYAAAPMASGQGVYETAGCDTGCAPAKKKCALLECLKPKPKTYTYEWVLKKKKVHGHGNSGCDTCGSAAPASYAVTPSAQYASPQGATYAAPQTYGSGQSAYGAAQTASVYPTSEMKSAEPVGDAVPPAPSAPAPAAPAAPAPPAPAGAQSSLLFLQPSGN